MECKGTSGTGINATVDVLIETLWNVKTEARSLSLSAPLVLIETLWNVKRVPTVPYLAKGAVY